MSERAFGVLLRRLFIRPETETQTPAIEGGNATSMAKEPQPPLVALLPAFAGVTAYNLRSFKDAHAAATFFEASKPSSFYREGVIAFWALHEAPLDVTDAECAVLVRTGSDQDLVHAYAFVDLETALSYVRFRVDENGESLHNFLVYWSVRVTIAANPSGEVRIEPATPAAPNVCEQPLIAEPEEVTVVRPEATPPEVEVEAPEERDAHHDGPDTRVPAVDAPGPLEVPVEPDEVGEAVSDEVAAPAIEPPRRNPEPVSTTTIRRYRTQSRVRAKALELAAAGHSGREVERQLRSAFSRDRVPSYSTITRWLRAAKAGRSSTRKLESMRTRARTILEDRFDELDDLPLADVARVAALIEELRKAP